MAIRRRVLVEGVSKRQGLRETGMHWTTLEKVLTHSEPPGHRRRREPEKPKIGPHLGWLAEGLKADEALPQKPRHTAKRLWRRWRDEKGGVEGTVKYAPVAAACAQERTDYPTYLERLAERERIDRERRAAERRIRAARFPVTKTLDPFDFAAQPSINEPPVRQLMTGAILDRLTHRVHLLEANGESYRLRESKRRQKARRRQPNGRTKGIDAPSAVGSIGTGCRDWGPPPAAVLLRPLQFRSTTCPRPPWRRSLPAWP